MFKEICYISLTKENLKGVKMSTLEYSPKFFGVFSFNHGIFTNTAPLRSCGTPITRRVTPDVICHTPCTPALNWSRTVEVLKLN